MPPNQRATRTTTRSSPCPSMAARIGRPAVPPTSPSSLKRYALPMRQAQALWWASAMRCARRIPTAWSTSCTGMARATKRLRLTSSVYSAVPASVSLMRMHDAPSRRAGAAACRGRPRGRSHPPCPLPAFPAGRQPPGKRAEAPVGRTGEGPGRHLAFRRYAGRTPGAATMGPPFVDERMTAKSGDRRPLRTRDAGWARKLASVLARSPVTANQISMASVLFALAGAASLLLWRSPLAMLVCAACIQLRLLCNLLDGMLAIEGGRSTPAGPLYNEFPDRIADALLLVALGHAAGEPWL